MIKLPDERQFDMVLIGYTGLSFPNPETVCTRPSPTEEQQQHHRFQEPRVDEMIERTTVRSTTERDHAPARNRRHLHERASLDSRVVRPIQRASLSGTSSGHPDGVLTPHRRSTGTSPSCGGSIPKRPEARTGQARSRRSLWAKAASDDKYWLEFAKIE